LSLDYIDVCSGISAPTQAWQPLGWRPLCYAEIAEAPRAVLKHHYPEVPLHGDFTKIEGDEHGSADLIVGGTPCQGFSVAGRRGGLDDERSVLSLEFARLAYRSRARWMVWENTPGAFSTNDGRDFGAILAEFSGHSGLVFERPVDGWRNSGVVEPADERSFGLAWRVLDALHFGVPQRRRRIFIVGYIGDWRPSAAVLFERHSMQGNHPPSREARAGVARTLTSSLGGASAKEQQFNFVGTDGSLLNPLDPFTGLAVPDAANCLTARSGKGVNSDLNEGQTLIPMHAHTLRGEGFDASEDGSGRGTPLVPMLTPTISASGAGTERTGNSRTEAEFLVPVSFSAKDRLEEVCEDFSPPLRAGSFDESHANGGVMPAVAFDAAQITHPENRSTIKDESPSLASGNRIMAANTMMVRRLTPRECERLQGFPDDFTLVPYRKRMMADGPRYKMIGNSQAVPVIRWIGERIEKVEGLIRRGA
jgi:DNA (cytosine-5)-methyltransferase 1